MVFQKQYFDEKLEFFNKKRFFFLEINLTSDLQLEKTLTLRGLNSVTPLVKSTEHCNIEIIISKCLGCKLLIFFLFYKKIQNKNIKKMNKKLTEIFSYLDDF